jgi:hypothetical protein
MCALVLRSRVWLLLLVPISLTGCRACGSRGGAPEGQVQGIKEADGAQRFRVQKGPIQAYYDRWGRLERIERDSNGDGKRDQVSHHAGEKNPALIEIDTDFDGRFDRWEYYQPNGQLTRIGTSRAGLGPDLWIATDAQGRVTRREYDDDHDAKVDRVEILENDHVTRSEIDSDRDGRIDRWQRWSLGRIVSEDLDSDGDGQADRTVLYGNDGKVRGLRRLPAR